MAAQRELDKSAVDSVAQGRVWSGADALELGLVDELGDLDAAVAYAAEAAGLGDDYGRRLIRTELSPFEHIVIDLLDTAASVGVDMSARTPTALERIAGRVEGMLTPLLHFDDPKGAYMHCLCDFE